MKLFHRNNYVDLKGAILACFLTAGYLKADPRLTWLPVDMTLLFAGLTVLLVFVRLLRNNIRAHGYFFWVLLLFGFFAIPLVWTDWTPYAFEKVTRLFSLTFLAATAPALLFDNSKDEAKFFNSLLVISLIMAIDSIVSMLSGGGGDRLTGGGDDRLTALGSNTIALGRAAGFAILWLVYLVESRALSLPAAALPLGCCVIAALGSGSRGPLAAVVFPFVLAKVAFSAFCFKDLLRHALVVGGIIFCLFLGMSLVPQSASEKIAGFLTGETDMSIEARRDAYALSVHCIPAHPFGAGWGGFSSINQNASGGYRIVTPSGNDGELLVYPHNILLELTLECGWACGLYFALSIIALMWSLWMQGIKKINNLAIILFQLVLFYFINALISGDINDNRHLLALLAVGMTSRRSIDEGRRRLFRAFGR